MTQLRALLLCEHVANRMSCRVTGYVMHRKLRSLLNDYIDAMTLDLAYITQWTFFLWVTFKPYALVQP